MRWLTDTCAFLHHLEMCLRDVTVVKNTAIADLESSLCILFSGCLPYSNLTSGVKMIVLPAKMGITGRSVDNDLSSEAFWLTQP